MNIVRNIAIEVKNEQELSSALLDLGAEGYIFVSVNEIFGKTIVFFYKKDFVEDSFSEICSNCRFFDSNNVCVFHQSTTNPNDSCERFEQA